MCAARGKQARKKTNGFSLVELLIVLLVVAVLAGLMVLAAGSGGDKAEAVKILSDLDAVKTAMLAYAADHPSRTADPLWGWEGASSAAIHASLDQYLERPVERELDVPNAPNGAIVIVFAGFTATDGLAEALDEIIAGNESYEGDYSGGEYTLALRVR